MYNFKAVRDGFISEKVLFLDGVSGTGKTMMGPILGSFERVEIGRFNHLYEYLCALHSFGRIQDDAARVLTRMYTDLDLYNLMISREVNLRPGDLSGIFSNPQPIKYLSRLFKNDGNAAMVRVKAEKPILHIISHQALSVMGLVFDSLGDRLRVVEMLRHPLYLVDHWETVVSRFGTDPRDFTLCIESGKSILPWYATYRAEEYKAATPFDRVIYILDGLQRAKDSFLESLSSERRSQVLQIPFEKFVLGPNPYIHEIERFLESKSTAETEKILKRQNCPRKQIMDGPAKAIYKRYAWRAPEKNVTDSQDFDRRLVEAKKRASPGAFRVLEALGEDYIKNYGMWF